MAEVLPDVPFAFKFIVKGTRSSLPYVNTFYATRASSGQLPQATLDTIADTAKNVYWSSFGPVLTTGTSHVVTQAIDLANKTWGFGTSTAAATGTKAGSDILPASVACCVSEVINDRYRGGHPRFYLPAALLSDITASRNWVSGALQAYNDAARAFRTGINAMTAGGTTWKLVAVRYHSGGLLLTSPLVRDVTNMVVHNRIDSMRRRTGKEVA